MAERTIAVGDIHGCAAALETLLSAIAPDASDTIVTLGDYVDRGPDSRRVMNRLLQLVDECRLVPLLGNHEAMLLMSHQQPEHLPLWLECGGQATLDSYGGGWEDVPEEHFAFWRACRPSHETRGFLFLHANYDATLPLHQQNEYDLLWKHLSMGVPSPHVSGKTAIVGHTPQPKGEILDLGHLICIDTCCFGGGWLTALDVESRRTWQADLEGNLRET